MFDGDAHLTVSQCAIATPVDTTEETPCFINNQTLVMEFGDVLGSVHQACFDIQTIRHIQSMIEVIHSFTNVIILSDVVSIDQ